MVNDNEKKDPVDVAYANIMAINIGVIAEVPKAAISKRKIFRANATSAIEGKGPGVRAVLDTLDKGYKAQQAQLEEQLEQIQENAQQNAAELEKKLQQSKEYGQTQYESLQKSNERVVKLGEELDQLDAYAIDLQGELDQSEAYAKMLQRGLTQTQSDYTRLIWAIVKSLSDDKLTIILREAKSREDLRDSKLALKDGARARQIGEVVDYFPNLRIAHVKLSGEVKAGDWISIRTKDELNKPEYEQQLKILEVGYDKVEQAKAGDVITVKVGRDIKEGYKAYRV